MIDILEEQLNMITFGQLVSLEDKRVIELKNIGVKLHRCGDVPIKGRLELKDLNWVKYRIEMKDQDWYKYNYINIMPYMITKEDLECAKVYASGVSYKAAERPHVDWNTGNVHPESEDLDNIKFKDRHIKQVVLVINKGPAIKECFTEPYYEYKANLKVTKEDGEVKIDETAPKYVPKACYYPLIKGSIDSIEEDIVKESTAQKLLRDICGALVKKLEINC